ncbi:MAG: hypothetical protein ACLVCH_12720 [Roseburia inulinivorans]
MPKEKKGGWSAAAIVLWFSTSPFWLDIAFSRGITFPCGCWVTLFGIALQWLQWMVSLVFAGFLLIGFGFGTLFTGGVAVGLGLTGAGLLVLGLGILAVLLVVWVSGVFLPWAVRGIIGLCKKPFEKKKESGWQHEKIHKIMLIIAGCFWCRTDLLRWPVLRWGFAGVCMAKNGELRYGIVYWSGGTLL